MREDRAYDEIPEDYEAETASSFNARQQPSQLQSSFQQPSISQPIPKSLEEEMADEVARQEEAELQAYLEEMEAQSQSLFKRQAQQQQSHQTQMHPQQSHQNIQHGQPQISWQGQQQQHDPVHIQKSASDDIDYDKMFDDMNMDTGVPDDEDMMDMN